MLAEIFLLKLEAKARLAPEDRSTGARDPRFVPAVQPLPMPERRR